MTHINPNIDEGDRLLDLLADEQTLGLAQEDRIELEDIISGATMADREREAFEHTAACAMIALAETQREQMPAELREKLYASIGKPAAHTAPPAIALEAKPTEYESELVIRRNLAFHYAGWFAAAACFMMATIAWWPAPGTATTSELIEKIAAVETAPDTVELTWADWDNPDLGGDAEIQGVTGKAVWSDTANTGYMVFNNLPKLDDADYQLWIIDAERGMTQRISGGVFNGTGEDGEIRIPIADTPIPVSSAAAFAITIEKPGGTWVSDMSRRVVIAARG